MTAVRNQPEDELVELELVTRVRRRRMPRIAIDMAGRGVVWAGIGLTVVGFALIAVAWGQVADETQVYLQMPYVVSAGLTGLGLILVGLTVVNIAVRARDAVERERQMDQLVGVLEEVRNALGERGGRRR